MDEKNRVYRDHLIARAVVSLGIVTAPVLRSMFQELKSKDPAESLLQLLIGKKLLSGDQLATVEAFQRKKRSRKISGTAGFLSDEQILQHVLLQEGLIDLQDLEKAVVEQKKLLRKQLQFHLGEVLVRLKLVKQADVARILKEKRGNIMDCPHCDLTYHVTADAGHAGSYCPKCKGKLVENDCLYFVETDGKVM